MFKEDLKILENPSILGSVLLERRHDHVVHALNTIVRVLNNKQLEELRTCSVDQISILVVQRHDHALLFEKGKLLRA